MITYKEAKKNFDLIDWIKEDDNSIYFIENSREVDST